MRRATAVQTTLAFLMDFPILVCRFNVNRHNVNSVTNIYRERERENVMQYRLYRIHIIFVVCSIKNRIEFMICLVVAGGFFFFCTVDAIMNIHGYCDVLSADILSLNFQWVRCARIQIRAKYKIKFTSSIKHFRKGNKYSFFFLLCGVISHRAVPVGNYLFVFNFVGNRYIACRHVSVGSQNKTEIVSS